MARERVKIREAPPGTSLWNLIAGHGHDRFAHAGLVVHYEPVNPMNVFKDTEGNSIAADRTTGGEPACRWHGTRAMRWRLTACRPQTGLAALAHKGRDSARSGLAPWMAAARPCSCAS